MNCIICNAKIPDGRLKALPRTKTCTNCSEIEKVAGFRIISGKTEYCELQIVSQKTHETLSRLQYRQGVGPGNGVLMDSYKKLNNELTLKTTKK